MNTRGPKAARTPTSPGTLVTVPRTGSRASPRASVSPTSAPSTASSEASTSAPPVSARRSHSPAGEVSIRP